MPILAGLLAATGPAERTLKGTDFTYPRQAGGDVTDCVPEAMQRVAPQGRILLQCTVTSAPTNPNRKLLTGCQILQVEPEVAFNRDAAARCFPRQMVPRSSVAEGTATIPISWTPLNIWTDNGVRRWEGLRVSVGGSR